MESRPGVLAAMWRLRWLVVALTLLGAVSGYVVVAQQTPVYEARARLTLADPSATTIYRSPVTQNAGRRAGNVVQRLTSPAVADRASALLGGQPSGPVVSRSLRASAVEESDLVDVVATDSTAAGATALADAVAAAYDEVAAEELTAHAEAAVAQLDGVAGELRTRLADLDLRVTAARDAAVEAALAADPALTGGDLFDATRSRLSADGAYDALVREQNDVLGELEQFEQRKRQVRIDAGLYGSGVADVEPAAVPDAPVRPRPRAAGLLGGAIGLFASAALAAALGAVRRGIEDPAAPAPVLGVPLLAAVPAFAARDAHTLPDPAVGAADAAAAGAYAVSAATLSTALARRGGRVLLVTTPARGDGASLTAFNLAAAVSGQGKRVVLLDPESLDELAPGHSPSASLKIVPLDDPAPHVAVAAALDRLRAEADLVVVDAPGLLSSARAPQVAALADGLLLVVARGVRHEALERTRERIDLLGVPVLGYVFNRTRAPGRGTTPAWTEDTSPAAPARRSRRPRVPAGGA